MKLQKGFFFDLSNFSQKFLLTILYNIWPMCILFNYDYTQIARQGDDDKE